MQRTIRWTLLLAIALTARLLIDGNRAAAQETLPSPGGDGAAFELELPPPPQAVGGTQQPRDYSQPYLGVKFDPEIRNAAVARSVTAGGPADQAGLRAGDTIVRVNGRPIGSYEDILQIVGRLKPGDVLDIDVVRRVSLSARAVLDGQPLDERRTTGYRFEAEPLPVPSGYREPPRQVSPQYNRNTARPRPNYNAPDDRRGNANRNERPDERDRGYRNRVAVPGRRR